MKTARLKRDRTGGMLGKLLAMRGKKAREKDMRATISKLLLVSAGTIATPSEQKYRKKKWARQGVSGVGLAQAFRSLGAKLLQAPFTISLRQHAHQLRDENLQV